MNDRTPDSASPLERDTLSMSTDNTAAGRLSDIANAGPIALVESGMSVRTAGGKEIGKVDVVQMGDINAVDSRNEDWGNVVDPLIKVGYAIFGAGSEIPENVRQRLLLEGYLLVDGKGWLLERDFYAASSQIARVEGDTVHLAVDEDQLFKA
jgi:hypothetical protein